jgi:hypothetical protein
VKAEQNASELQMHHIFWAAGKYRTDGCCGERRDNDLYAVAGNCDNTIALSHSDAVERERQGRNCCLQFAPSEALTLSVTMTAGYGRGIGLACQQVFSVVKAEIGEKPSPLADIA